MYKVEEYHGSIYLRDADTNDILSELTQPAAIVMGWNDPDHMITVVKLGNRDKIKSLYDKKCEAAKQVPGLLEDYTYMDLPLDIEFLNKLYNGSGNLRTLLKKFM